MIKRILVLWAVFGAYIVWADGRRFTAEWTQLWTEPLMLLLVYALLRAPLRKDWKGDLAAALPLVWLYLIHDEYFARWGDVPSISDIALAKDLWVVAGPVWGALGLCVALIPVIVWLRALDRSRLRRIIWPLLPLSALTLALFVAPTGTYLAITSLTPETEWADRTTAEEWGRMYSVLLRQARRLHMSEEMRGFGPIERTPLHIPAAQLAAIDQRNVHLFVMESFVDLRLLSKVTFSAPPFDADLARWIDPFISASVSPAFGGETARAEFEILCGVPSLRAFGVEFLSFTGARTYCLPTILGQAGYRTVLTFPFSPVFFNTRRAYPGLGFEQTIYAQGFSTPEEEAIVLDGVDYLEDGLFFPQNLATVRRLVAQGKPFLNYVMTLYGHWPFDIDHARHPKAITASAPEVEKIANQMLLRTRALHTHLQAVLTIDPHAVIIVVADHLPTLPDGAADYLRLGYAAREGDAKLDRDLTAYDNFLLVIVDGVPQRVPRMRHFDISRWILNELSHGATCADPPCAFGQLPYDRQSYVPTYQTILGLAAGKR